MLTLMEILFWFLFSHLFIFIVMAAVGKVFFDFGIKEYFYNVISHYKELFLAVFAFKS